MKLYEDEVDICNQVEGKSNNARELRDFENLVRPHSQFVKAVSKNNPSFDYSMSDPNKIPPIQGISSLNNKLDFKNSILEDQNAINCRSIDNNTLNHVLM